MTAPINDRQNVAFDPSLYKQSNPDVTYTQLASKVIDNQKPTNDNQYVFGYVLICITLLIAFKMHLSYKKDSPSAKAEQDLKSDLLCELGAFKDSITDKTQKRDRFVDNKLAILDKESSLLKMGQENQLEKMHTLEMSINQNFSGLHSRFTKLEETLIIIAQSGIDKQ